MSRSQLNLILLGIMLSLFLASMEGTVVATAMPSIVAQLGGLSIYSWVFSIYMLCSTITTPLYGKFSDLYGRKLIYTLAMALFLVGSILCGQANSMTQLIAFRAVQGLGAGGVLPLAFTIIGELLSLEQRAKMQGLFSGVWGVSAVIGPLIGGFLVDQVSWHWIFYINILPGILAIGLVLFAWRDSARETTSRVAIDYLGALFLTLGTLCLLLGLGDPGASYGRMALAASAILLGGLYWVERRAADPILPLPLFKGRLFSAAILHGMFAGWAMFGSLSFIPLFVQAVIGTSATQAGISLTPMSLSWTLASILGSRLLLKIGYRTLALFGTLLLAVGALLMTQVGTATSQASVMLYTGLMGVGMGFSVPAFLIAVQSTVRRSDLGTATATIQFSRSIGGTLGVSIMGAFLSAGLARRLTAAGLQATAVSLNSLLDPLGSAGVTMEGALRQALALSLASMFVIAFAAAAASLLSVLLAPGGKLAQLSQERTAAPLE